jgi:hypothetical protein
MRLSVRTLVRRLGLLVVLVASPMAGGACATGSHMINPVTPGFRLLSPEAIRIYAGDAPLPLIAIIGPIAVDELGGTEQAAAMLKSDAARIGADAVIRLRLTKMMGYGSRTGLSGIAVRLTP